MIKINANITERVETGALQINDDWKGLFIRGDWCIELMFILGKVLDGHDLNIFEQRVLAEYIDTIKNEVLK